MLSFATAATAVVAGSWLFTSPAEPGRRFCGHEDTSSIVERLGLIHRTHCCLSGRAISKLVELHLAQSLHYADHQEFAASIESLEALAPTLRRPTNDFTLHYAVDRHGWSAHVPKTPNLAGHYLLTNDIVFFHPDRPATSQDLALRRLTPIAPANPAVAAQSVHP